jgi:hypothetical protein
MLTNMSQNAWDSYIQGQNMDATNSFFPMDVSAMQTDSMQPTASNTHGPPQDAQAAFSTSGVINGGVFMGVSTLLDPFSCLI